MSQTQAGLVVGGRYRLEKILGEGGMAVVWRAVHTETDRVVALKLVRPNLLENEQARELFVREARIAARIGRSDHIVDVLDAGIDPTLEVPFLVMELLEGEPLDVRLRREGPISGELAADLVEQLGEALDQAHSAGVVHRDLKPQNLFLAKDRKGRTTVKVLDFGIAKLAETTSASATQIGTPAYSAPEQLGASWRVIAEKQGSVISSTVGPATDVWALGLVVYEMLTGSASGDLWAATTLAELPVKIVLEPTPSAIARAGAKARLLPPGFDAWLARCLALDASARWPRAGEAARAVAASLRGGTSQAFAATASRPPSAPEHPPAPSAIAPAAPPPHHVSQSSPSAWASAPTYPPGASPSQGPPAYPPPAFAAPARASALPAGAFTAPPWGPPPVDPRLAAWSQERRFELRPASFPELKRLEPWVFLPTVGRSGIELSANLDEARASLCEIFGGDVVSQAMGEERLVLAIVSTPRARGRVALRSKMTSGIADDIGRGLKLLDGLVGGSATAKSIGDPFLEARFDVSSPSMQEGNAVLPVAARQVIVHSGFRGVIELRPGLLAVMHQGVRAFEPSALDFLLGFVSALHRAFS